MCRYESFGGLRTVRFLVLRQASTADVMRCDASGESPSLLAGLRCGWRKYCDYEVRAVRGMSLQQGSETWCEWE
jgi:hypothetical protein